jgi:hypothetical protein
MLYNNLPKYIGLASLIYLISVTHQATASELALNSPQEQNNNENVKDKDNSNENQTNEDDESYQRFIYRSPEERREAGLGRQITDWLKISGVIEYEQAETKFNFISAKSIKEEEKPKINLQWAMEFEFTEQWLAELVVEAEYGEQYSESKNKHQGHDSFIVDEALVSYETEQWGFTLGRFNVPFGEYYSHFVTSPLVEFGETRGNTLVVDYSPIETIEFYIFAIDSEIFEKDNKNNYDWGAGLEWQSDDDAFRFNISYFSDISESDEKFLEKSNTSLQDVSAINVNAMLGFEYFEVTIETTRALDEYQEMDLHVNQPSSSNIEIAFFPFDNLQLAMRYEKSNEFEEQPEKRMGVSLTWQPINNLTLVVDTLTGDYKNFHLPIDEEDEPEPILKDQHTFALQLFYEF